MQKFNSEAIIEGTTVNLEMKDCQDYQASLSVHLSEIISGTWTNLFVKLIALTICLRYYSLKKQEHGSWPLEPRLSHKKTLKPRN